MTPAHYCGYCGADLRAAEDGAFCGRCGAPRDGAAWTLTDPTGAPPTTPADLSRLWRLAMAAAGETPTRQVIVATTLLVTTAVVVGVAYHLLLGCVPLLLIALALHLWLSHPHAPRPGQGRRAGRPARSTDTARTHDR